MKPQPAEDFQEWEHVTQLLSSFIIHDCGYYVPTLVERDGTVFVVISWFQLSKP